MADYGTAGICDHDGAPLDPAKLPLSPKLRTRIERPVPEILRNGNRPDAFAAEGHAIARAVKAEMPHWSVVYFDEAAAARAQYQGAPASFEIELP